MRHAADRTKFRHAGIVFAVSVLLFALLLAPAATAAPTTRAGEITIPIEGMTVGAGEVLELAPGARVTGGPLRIEGRLVIGAAGGAPVLVEAPLVLAGGDLVVVNSVLAAPSGASLSILTGHADVTGSVFRVPSAADSFGVVQEGGRFVGAGIELTGSQAPSAGGIGFVLRGGDLALSDSRFSGAQRGLEAAGGSPADAVLKGVTFTNVRETAVHVTEDASLRLDRSWIRGSTDGVVVTSGQIPSRITIDDVTFAGNERNVVLLQRTAATGGTLLSVIDSNLGATSGPRAARPEGVSWTGASFAARSNDVPMAILDTVLFANNVVTGADVGVFLMGEGVSFVGSNNSFRGNTVGFHSDTSNAVLTGNSFESTRFDLLLTGPANRISLSREKYDPARVHIQGGQGLIETEAGIITRETLVAGAAAAGGAIGLLAVLAVVSHTVRDLLLRGLFLPLYARLSPHEVLSHDKRKDIVSYLEGNGGAHLRGIGRALNLTYGTLTYHLYRLEKEGIIVTSEDGLFKRYYLSAGRRRPVEVVAEEVEGEAPKPAIESLRDGERQIFEDILANPGSPQSLVAERLGLSRQALHYHIKRLAARGYIRKVNQGRETLCYANLEPAPPAAPEGSEAAS